MKIRLAEVEFFHADRRTDRLTTNLIVAFRNFANAPKMPLFLRENRPPVSMYKNKYGINLLDRDRCSILNIWFRDLRSVPVLI